MTICNDASAYQYFQYFDYHTKSLKTRSFRGLRPRAPTRALLWTHLAASSRLPDTMTKLAPPVTSDPRSAPTFFLLSQHNYIGENSSPGGDLKRDFIQNSSLYSHDAIIINIRKENPHVLEKNVNSRSTHPSLLKQQLTSLGFF